MLADGVKRRTQTWHSLYPAAIDLFYERGYEAATLRQLASSLGVQAGSIYNYVPSKQELLFTIIRTVMEELIAESLDAAQTSRYPVERLGKLVRNTVIFHATHTKEVFIGNHELRSLEPDNLAAVMALRDRFERIYQEVLAQGAEQGIFDCADVKVASYGLLTMCTGVSSWYRSDGRLSAASIADMFADMAVRSVASTTG